MMVAGAVRVVIAHCQHERKASITHELRRAGYAAVCVHSGVELWRLLDADAIDVLLIDAALDSNGLVLMEEYTYASRLPTKGWFAVVEPGDDAASCYALLLGAAAVLRTPLRASAVTAAIERLLESFQDSRNWEDADEGGERPEVAPPRRKRTRSQAESPPGRTEASGRIDEPIVRSMRIGQHWDEGKYSGASQDAMPRRRMASRRCGRDSLQHRSGHFGAGWVT